MSESRPNPTLTPEAALALAREYLPGAMLPPSGPALYQRLKRRTIDMPVHLVRGPGLPSTGKYLFDAEEVRAWCLAQLPFAVAELVRARDYMTAEICGAYNNIQDARECPETAERHLEFAAERIDRALRWLGRGGAHVED